MVRIIKNGNKVIFEVSIVQAELIQRACKESSESLFNLLKNNTLPEHIAIEIGKEAGGRQDIGEAIQKNMEIWAKTPLDN